MRQLLSDRHHRVPLNSKDQRTMCVIGHSPRTKGQEVHDQLHHHPAVSVREENILCRLSVHEVNVVGAAQAHEEVIYSGHNHGQRNKKSPTVST